MQIGARVNVVDGRVDEREGTLAVASVALVAVLAIAGTFAYLQTAQGTWPTRSTQTR